MTEVIPFKAEHWSYFVKNGIKDKSLQPFIIAEQGPLMEKRGDTFSILEDEKPVVIGGIKMFWPNRGELWAIFGDCTTNKYVRLSRLIKNFLEKSPLKRIELVVDKNFCDGHRFARFLGFEKEADCLKSYLPGGQDASLYARVRG